MSALRQHRGITKAIPVGEAFPAIRPCDGAGRTPAPSWGGLGRLQERTARIQRIANFFHVLKSESIESNVNERLVGGKSPTMLVYWLIKARSERELFLALPEICCLRSLFSLLFRCYWPLFFAATL
jgi:hypothetical protein